MAGTIENGRPCVSCAGAVSMESGLDGRNNENPENPEKEEVYVSMESGLDGRNNAPWTLQRRDRCRCLNGVRPRWPEQ